MFLSNNLPISLQLSKLYTITCIPHHTAKWSQCLHTCPCLQQFLLRQDLTNSLSCLGWGWTCLNFLECWDCKCVPLYLVYLFKKNCKKFCKVNDSGFFSFLKLIPLHFFLLSRTKNLSFLLIILKNHFLFHWFIYSLYH